MMFIHDFDSACPWLKTDGGLFSVHLKNFNSNSTGKI